MGFFKIIESELNNIVQIVAGNSSSTKSQIVNNETEKLQGLLNNRKNEPLVDVAQKRTISARVNEPLVQNAIKGFNQKSQEERECILEKVDTVIQEKLMSFMEANAKYTDNIESTNYLFRQVNSKAYASANRKVYTYKEMAVLLKDFQRFIAKCNIEADRVMNAFSEYRGKRNINCGKICDGNKDEFAISMCSRFKQAINSYNQVFISNVQELLKVSESSKPDFMNNLMRTIEKIQSEVEHFQTKSRDLMNAFIPDVIAEENNFSKSSINYSERGIPADLCLSNKVFENILIDTLLEEANNNPITDAA